MSNPTAAELNLPTWATGAPSSVHALTPGSFFKANWRGWPVLFGFAAATFLLPLSLFQMDRPDRPPNIPPYASNILLATGALVMILSVVMAILNYRWLPQKVLVFSEGVVWVQKGATHSKKWREVAEVWRTELIGQVDIHFVKLFFSDGGHVKFQHSLADYLELAEAVEQLSMMQLLGKFVADLAAGKEIAFGKAKVTPQGVAYEGEQWLWQEIQGVTIQRGSLIFERGQGWDKNGFIDTAEIPNYHVLWQLASDRIGQNA